MTGVNDSPPDTSGRADDEPRYTNRLIHETSPYLLQRVRAPRMPVDRVVRVL